MFGLWAVSVTAPLLSWLAPPEAKVTRSNRIEESVRNIINGRMSKRKGPTRVWEDNRINRCSTQNGELTSLLEQALAVLGELNLTCVLILDALDLNFSPWHGCLTLHHGQDANIWFLLSLTVIYADGDSMQDWYRSVYIGTYIGSKWKLRSAKICIYVVLCNFTAGLYSMLLWAILYRDSTYIWKACVNVSHLWCC
jgi:hypothetical protein